MGHERDAIGLGGPLAPAAFRVDLAPQNPSGGDAIDTIVANEAEMLLARAGDESWPEGVRAEISQIQQLLEASPDDSALAQHAGRVMDLIVYEHEDPDKNRAYGRILKDPETFAFYYKLHWGDVPRAELRKDSENGGTSFLAAFNQALRQSNLPAVEKDELVAQTFPKSRRRGKGYGGRQNRPLGREIFSSRGTDWEERFVEENTIVGELMNARSKTFPKPWIQMAGKMYLPISYMSGLFRRVDGKEYSPASIRHILQKYAHVWMELTGSENLLIELRDHQKAIPEELVVDFLHFTASMLKERGSAHQLDGNAKLPSTAPKTPLVHRSGGSNMRGSDAWLTGEDVRPADSNRRVIAGGRPWGERRSNPKHK